MTTINKTYTFTNTSNLSIINKTAEVRVGDEVKPSTVNVAGDNLTISATLTLPIDGDITIRVQLDIGDENLICTKEVIDPLTELINFQFLSLHFRGNHKVNIIESNFKFRDISFHNIFDSCQGVSYKYAPQIGNIDWSSITESTVSQLQTLINNGPSSYSIRVEIQDYNQGSDCGICMNYFTQNPISSTTYTFQGISRDVVIWLNRKISIQSESTTSGMNILGYALLDSSYANNLIGSNLVNRTTLNSQIASTSGEYAIQLFVDYTDYSGTISSGTVTLNNITI